MIVTASALAPALMFAPVVLPAAENATVNASSPSTKTSSTAAIENTIGAKLSPSAVAVNVSTPVSLSKLTPVVAEAAASRAAKKAA